MTRWNPSVSFGLGFADNFLKCCGHYLLPMRSAGGVRRPTGHSVEEIAVLFDMRGQSHCVFAHQPLGRVGVALLQRGDDGAVIDDGALCAIVVGHRNGANRAHVDEQIVGQAGHQLHAAHSDDRLVEPHVRLRVFRDLLRRVFLEHVDEGMQLCRSVSVTRALRAVRPCSRSPPRR